MRFAIVTEVPGEAGKVKSVVPIVSVDLANAIIDHVKTKLGPKHDLEAIERSIRESIAEEEDVVRQETITLSSEHH